ncbi:MAG: hypothetical protein EPN21_07965 [Methylococcaceae bacterium]|nr:MAG: hypothetical protein EPN21_07965 [Methylococcaceae bacterium]
MIDRVPDNLPLHLLPPTLRQIAELCGLPVLVKLVRRFGGSSLWIPQADHLTDSPLLPLIGAEAAQRLAAAFGGRYLPIGKAHQAMLHIRDAQITYEHYQLGYSVVRLARRWWLSDRQIRTIVGKTPLPASPQLDLFGEVA